MDRNLSWAITSALLTLILLGTPVGSEPLTVEKFLSLHQKATESLEDVKANATLALNLQLGVLPYSERLNGSYFYLKPNKHKLNFQDAPSYFDKAPSMFQWQLPPLEKYRAEVAGPLNQGSKKAYQLLFRPKATDSSTQSVTCTFNAENWRLVEQTTVYRDGGSVALRFAYLVDSELPVIDTVTAAVNIPTYSLTGKAVISFSNQIINEGLDAGVFEEKTE